MYKKIICLLLITITAGTFFAQARNVDSSKFRFSFLISSKPLFNALSAKDSAQNFMYSHNQFEFQIGYKKHQLNIGFDAYYRKTDTKVNNLPKVSTQNKLFFNPSYSFQVYSNKKWSCFVGVGYLKNVVKNSTEVTSSIEIINSSETQTEEGANAYFRANYKLSKRFSIEMETSFYYSRERVDKENKYSLTTSLNNVTTFYRDFRTYAFPSNIWLKYTF